MKLYLALFFTVVSIYSFSQEKNEVERPFPVAEVPSKAKSFVCELFPEGKVKWVMERSDAGDKLEAKVKAKQKRISIEFSRKGVFEDVEERVLMSAIKSGTTQEITKKLTIDFDRFKVKKIQHHYSGNKEEILTLYKTGKARFNFISQLYEIVVYGIKDKQINAYEYTFLIDGSFVSRLKMAEGNTDNLLF